MREGIPLDALNWFGRGYELHTPKSVGREESKACALSVVPHFSLSRRVSPFLAWVDFHARSRFARSTIPEEKWGTTRSLMFRRWTKSKNQSQLNLFFSKLQLVCIWVPTTRREVCPSLLQSMLINILDTKQWLKKLNDVLLLCSSKSLIKCSEMIPTQRSVIARLYTIQQFGRRIKWSFLV